MIDGSIIVNTDTIFNKWIVLFRDGRLISTLFK